MEHHGYGKLVKNHMDKRQAHRSGKYHQSAIDKEHESMGMKKHGPAGMKKYHMENSHRR